MPWWAKRERAYDRIVKPFREAEDVLMAGPALGALDALLRLAAPHSRDEEALGRLQCLISGLSAISGEAAGLLDARAPASRVTPLCLAFREVQEVAAKVLAGIREGFSGDPGERFGTLWGDLSAVSGIARNVSALKRKKLGRDLLATGR